MVCGDWDVNQTINRKFRLKRNSKRKIKYLHFKRLLQLLDIL